MAEKDKSTPEKPSTAKKPAGKVFDISRPGKSMATPTSRPIITNNQVDAQNSQTSVSGVGDNRPLLSRRKLQILPLTDGEKAEAAQAPSETPAKEAPPSEKPAEEAPMPNADKVEGQVKAQTNVAVEPAAEPAAEPAEPEPAPEPLAASAFGGLTLVSTVVSMPHQ